MTLNTTAPPEVEVADETETRAKQLPPYAVVIHNDDHNSVVFVTLVLQKVFSYPLEKCFQIMMEAHETGRAVAWVGSREVAELKADQIHSCGGDPGNSKAGALGVTVEAV